jgi:hypothetical protein
MIYVESMMGQSKRNQSSRGYIKKGGSLGGLSEVSLIFLFSVLTRGESLCSHIGFRSFFFFEQS